MFRGNAPARIDDKGRLKVPTAFRSLLESKYGRELFVTSVTGESVRLYPMPVWLDLEQRLDEAPTMHPARLRFLDRVNYYGQIGEIDVQGRVLIPVRLREAASMLGDVDVLGQIKFLEVWNHDRFVAKMLREPYTDEDAKQMSGFGV